MLTADPLALIRAVHFAATLLASGTAFFTAFVVGSTRRPKNFPILQRRMNALIWIGLALAVVTGAMWIIWLAANILDKSLAEVCLDGGAWSVLTDTRFGWICCLRLALAVLIGFLVLNPTQHAWPIAAGTAFLVLPAFASHAGATPGVPGHVHVVSDAAHLLSAGGWLGGLPAFVLLLWTTRQKPGWYDFTIGVTHRFSWVAAASVGVLLATGTVNSWYQLGSPRDLWTTDYGRLIGFKIILLAVMIAIATVNKFRLTPRLPARTAMRNLQRNGLVETGIGLCVIILVGYLGRLEPTAHIHPATTAIPPDAAFTHIHAPEAMADVTVNPGRPGRSTVTIRVSHEDFSAFAAKDVRLALDPPSGPLETLNISAKQQSDGTWMTDIVLAQAGIWTVRVTVIAQSGKAIVLDAPIVIER